MCGLYKQTWIIAGISYYIQNLTIYIYNTDTADVWKYKQSFTDLKVFSKIGDLLFTILNSPYHIYFNNIIESKKYCWCKSIFLSFTCLNFEELQMLLFQVYANFLHSETNEDIRDFHFRFLKLCQFCGEVNSNTFWPKFSE